MLPLRIGWLSEGFAGFESYGISTLDFNLFTGSGITPHASLSINILKRPESHKRDLAVLLL